MSKHQYEEDAKDHVIDELKRQGSGEWTVIATDVEVDPATHINFDYQLESEGRSVALEVFRLVESKEEIERSKSWSLISNKLAEELVSRGVAGYTIRTPYAFNVPKNKVQRFVGKIADKLQKAIETNPQAESIHESGFEVSWIKDFHSVSCYGIGPGGAVNPTADAFNFIERKLPKKNKQLNIANYERIIAIVNWLPLVGPDNVIEACGQIDFTKFENIDKVYFDNPHSGKVQLVYDRAIWAAFQPNGEAPEHLEPLFISWLTNYLYKMHPQAYRLVQQIAKREKSLMWLPPYAREQLVTWGEKFLEQDNRDEVRWIIERLKNDPDPPVVKPEDPDAKFSDHLRLLRGENARLIRGVRPRLCWLLMRVMDTQLDDYGWTLNIVESFATGENLYVRQQATIPLTRLTEARVVGGQNGNPFITNQALSERIKALALLMIDQNKSYPPVLESVAQMIVAIRDLDDVTALNVLTALEPVEQSEASSHVAWMFIYFSFFREQQYKELPPFDPSSIREIFKDRLRNNRLRGTVTVHFTSLLLNKQIAFEDLVPYLELIIAGKPDKYVNNRFYQLAASQAATHPAEIGSMMETVMDGELQALADGGIHEIWCPKDFARTIEVLEKARPEDQKRVAQLRQRMEPFRDRIHSLFDF
jgi:hypothetical protein